jgi:acetyl-CoA carboxylase biotin carboxylase subunit
VVEAVRAPGGPFVRDDSGVYPGSDVSSFYDPLISKLSTWAPNREMALARMRRALGEYVVTGIKTNLRFHERLLCHPEFAAGRYHTGFVDDHKGELIDAVDALTAPPDTLAVALAVAVARNEERRAIRDANGHAELSAWVSAHRARNRR